MKKSTFLLLSAIAFCTVKAASAGDMGSNEADPGVWDKTKGVASDVWDGTKEVTSDVWDGTKKVTSDVWNGTKEVGSDIKDGVTGDDETKADNHNAPQN